MPKTLFIILIFFLSSFLYSDPTSLNASNFKTLQISGNINLPQFGKLKIAYRTNGSDYQVILRDPISSSPILACSSGKAMFYEPLNASIAIFHDIYPLVQISLDKKKQLLIKLRLSKNKADKDINFDLKSFLKLCSTQDLNIGENQLKSSDQKTSIQLDLNANLRITQFSITSNETQIINFPTISYKDQEIDEFPEFKILLNNIPTSFIGSEHTFYDVNVNNLLKDIVTTLDAIRGNQTERLKLEARNKKLYAWPKLLSDTHTIETKLHKIFPELTE